jgi:hypothetical protein
MARWSLDSPEMRDLIERLAQWPHGLGFLHLADIDTVAINLHVHPFLVARARTALETPEGRDRLIDEVRKARARHGGDLPEPPPCPDSPPCPPAPKTAEELIGVADRHPLGLPFLEEGHPEAVAVIFGVHPNVVFEARAVLARRRRGGANNAASV